MWRLEGYDVFSDEYYPIEGEWTTEVEARGVAAQKLKEIQISQPTEDSGGQDDEAIQGRIFVIRPNGTKYRYLPVEAAS